MENKIAHLGMIQEVIARMSGNSLKMKEWCIGTLSADRVGFHNKKQ